MGQSWGGLALLATVPQPPALRLSCGSSRLGEESLCAEEKRLWTTPELHQHQQLPITNQHHRFTAVRMGGGARPTQVLFPASPWLAPPQAAVGASVEEDTRPGPSFLWERVETPKLILGGD